MNSPPFGALALGLWLAWLPAGSYAASECTPWPSEPRPLPRAASPDDPEAETGDAPEGSAEASAEGTDQGTAEELLSAWTKFRVRELARLATKLEAENRVEARRVWLHAQCLSPDADEIADGLERTQTRVVHRALPPPATGGDEEVDGGDPSVRHASVASALAELGAPDLGPGDVSNPDLLEVDAWLGAAASLVEQARFREASSQLDSARDRLAELEPLAGIPERRSRLELLAATAHMALRREGDARASVERALAADPNLQPDRASTPPKVQRLVDAVRADLAEESP